MSKFIVLSDVHLGQTGEDKEGQYSLLSRTQLRSAEPDRPAVRLREKVARFAAGAPVTLVAAGDLMDLSLAYLRDATDDLVSLLATLPEVERLVWVVGNHDHHIWMTHSEQRCVIEPLRTGELPLPGSPYRSTPRDRPEPTTLFDALFKGQKIDCKVELAYPEYALTLEGESGPELFYFTHGHLFGGIYTLLSDILREPINQEKAADWRVRAGVTRGVNEGADVAATVNMSLIEFVYWLLGETGHGFGADGLVEKVITGVQSNRDSEIRPLIRSAVQTLMPNGIVPGLPDSWERAAMTSLLTRLVEKTIKAEDGMDTSSSRFEAPDKTRAGLEKWLSMVKPGLLPRSYIVTGHTHRHGRYELEPGVSVFNMGSWLKTPEEHRAPEPCLMTIDDAGGRVSVEYGAV